MHFRLKQRGVTLMELMAVIMIVGILSAIAIPTYRTYTMKANRSDGKIALTNYAQQLERCYTTGQTYAGCLTGLPAPSPQSFYQMTIAVAPDGQSYLLTATPQAAQANDTQCPALTLTQANVRTPAINCW